MLAAASTQVFILAFSPLTIASWLCKRDCSFTSEAVYVTMNKVTRMPTVRRALRKMIREPME